MSASVPAHYSLSEVCNLKHDFLKGNREGFESPQESCRLALGDIAVVFEYDVNISFRVNIFISFTVGEFVLYVGFHVFFWRILDVFLLWKKIYIYLYMIRNNC